MLFDVTGVGHKVRWYRSKDGQPWAPDGNQFVSANWINRDADAGDLGEQPGTRPWKNGKDFRDYPVQTADPCTMDPLLVAGFSSGEEIGPWEGGKLLCCSGVVCCDRIDIPTSLTIRLDPPASGCACVTPLQSFTLTRTPDTCTWSGSDTVCGAVMQCDLTIGPDLATPSVLEVDWPGFFTGTATYIVHNCDPYLSDFAANFTSGGGCDATTLPFLWLVNE